MPRSTTRIVAAAAATALLMAAPAWAAPKDDVQAAVTKLANAKSYAFTTTVEGGGAGAGTGKVERGGAVSLALEVRNDTVNIVKIGDKVAVQTDDGWKGAGDLADAKRPVKNAANTARNFHAPAEDAAELLADATEVKRGEGGTYTADLTEAAAKKWVPVQRYARAAAAATTAPAGPTVKDAKATVTFTLADGSLTKMALHTTGTVTRAGNDRDIDRTVTTEIKDVDKTTADVPPEAKAQLKDTATAKPADKM